jgi:hypothetical protein
VFQRDKAFRVHNKLANGQGTRRTIGKMNLRVECYAGSKADEHPVRFHIGQQVRMVEEVLDQWYGPNDSFFKVRADDGNLYVLRRDGSTPEGIWTLESFRELKT